MNAHEELEYEYNARLDYLHELAVEHYDPWIECEWADEPDYNGIEPDHDAHVSAYYCTQDIPF